MEDFVLTTPVTFIIFNRPDTTIRVFNEIKRAKPRKLLIIADGPRDSKPGEKEKCEQTRAIVENIDWDCEVLRNYSDANLGCKKRVSSGLSWVFDNVEESIILEDDCIPEPSFFQFCQELLERYRDDERIMLISGDNMLFEKATQGDYSYYFSKYPHIWGWASWRRAWQHYDVNIKLLPEVKRLSLLLSVIPDNQLLNWYESFDRVYNGNFDTWDFQWIFTIWIQSGLSIAPCVNLISNIGFDINATHTRGDSIYSNMKTEEMYFPLKHPPYIIKDYLKDKLEVTVNAEATKYGWLGVLLPGLRRIRRILFSNK